MATIQFSGLASGLDTDEIIESLMEIESASIDTIEEKVTDLEDQLEAYGELDTLMDTLYDAIEDMNYSSQLVTHEATTSTDEYLTASATTTSVDGASYEVEVVSLAQVQKSVSSTGFADTSAYTLGTGTITLTVDGETYSLSLDEDTCSIDDLADAINNTDVGISASIMDTGDADAPYLLVLTGEDTSTTFSLDTSGLTGGTETLESMNVEEDDGTITNPPIQEAAQAHIVVDGIDVYSDSNTVEDAIEGVTIDLVSAEEGETTTITIESDSSNVETMMEEFVTAYNELVTYVKEQQPTASSEGGVLAGDSSVNRIKRKLQNLLTTTVETSGVYTALTQLGLTTETDGTLTLDSDTLEDALDENLDSVITLLCGEDDTTGIITQYKNYLSEQTDSSTGLLETKTELIDEKIERYDDQIERIEDRLEKKQATLEAQFTAMETLIAEYNTWADYLETMMDELSSD